MVKCFIKNPSVISRETCKSSHKAKRRKETEKGKSILKREREREPAWLSGNYSLHTNKWTVLNEEKVEREREKLLVTRESHLSNKKKQE